VLAAIARDFGFRSAVLIELTRDLQGLARVVDTDPNRDAAGQPIFAQVGLQPLAGALRGLIEADGVTVVTPGDPAPSHAYSEFLATYDLTEVVAVSMTLGDDVAGLIAFSGIPELSPVQLSAIQTLSYSLFAHLWALGAQLPALEPTRIHLFKPLTPREKEVMRLSASGRTSAQIACDLGLSPRTVNQHVENVAGKLGTRNRTHTIAELVRHHLLT
jgi:LuxR family quorum sensing-dependent transcriptional regulator